MPNAVNHVSDTAPWVAFYRAMESERPDALFRDPYARKLAGSRVLKMMERNWGKQLEAGGAQLRFAPAEGTAFFSPYGWTEAEFRSMWLESLRLGRSMPLARFWNFLGRAFPRRIREEFRLMSGVVLLKPSSPR